MKSAIIIALAALPYIEAAVICAQTPGTPPAGSITFPADTVLLVLQTSFVALQAIILAITAWVIYLYTKETRLLANAAVAQVEQVTKQTKNQIDSHTLSALAEIHAKLTNERSYQFRGYLHRDFPSDLVKVVRNVLAKDHPDCMDGVDGLNMEGIMRLPENLNELGRFNEELGREMATGVHSASAKDVVEGVLMDFDSLAIPVSLGIEAAMKAAKAYRQILEATAPMVLPFVAIHWRLRGSRDPHYKAHYIGLLRRLDIVVPDGLTPDSGS